MAQREFQIRGLPRGGVGFRSSRVVGEEPKERSRPASPQLARRPPTRMEVQEMTCCSGNLTWECCYPDTCGCDGCCCQGSNCSASCGSSFYCGVGACCTCNSSSWGYAWKVSPCVCDLCPSCGTALCFSNSGFDVYQATRRDTHNQYAASHRGLHQGTVFANGRP
jgi:hypothetical protein